MKRKSTLILAVVFLSIAFNPATLRAQDNADEVAIRKLVERFFDAYQKKDLNGVMACWSANSPMFADFKQFSQNNFTVSEETRFVNVTLSHWKIERNQAFVRLRFERKWRDVGTKKSAQQSVSQDVQFVKEADNWKFWLQRDTEIHFAERLDAAKSKEERARLLKDEKELVTSDLLTMIVVAGLKQAGEGKIDYALKLNDISLEVAEALGGADAKSQYHWFRAGIFYYQTKYQEALEDYQRALRLHREVKNRRREAVTLKNIGEIYQLTNRYAEAIAHFEESLEATREIGNRAQEATILRNIGIIYGTIGKYTESLNRFEASLKISRDIGDREGEALTFANIGIVYQSKGRYADALIQYETSLKAIREIGDKQKEAKILGNIGIVYGSTGKYAEALTQLEASLAVARETGDKADEASARNNIGNVYRLTGRYAEALAQHEASLQLDREIRNKVGQAYSLNNIGNDYQSTGRYAEALGQYEASLKLKRETGDKVGEAETLNNIGIVYALTGKYAEALAQHEASLEVMREIGNKAGEATSLREIGIIHASSGKYVEALSKFEASLKIDREIGDRAGESASLGNIGIVYQSTGRQAEALAQYEASLKLSREIGDTAREAASLTNIGTVYQLQKQWRQAADAYQRAISHIELIRTQTKEPSLQTSFFAQNTSPYYGLIESLLELGSSPDEIFAVGERAKARTMVELMSGGRVNILKSMTKVERRQEQELKANFIAASAQLNAASSGASPDRQRIDELKQQMNRARDNYAQFRVKLFVAHPELQIQRASYDPPALGRLSEPLFAKDPDLCLLSYLVGDDKTFLFVITGGRNANAPVNLKVYTLKVDKNRELTARELKDRLNAFRQRATDESGVYKQKARDLYELLLAPAENELKDRGHVVIIPDGMLYALPFQMLLDGQGKHFVESHTVSYAPSVTALIQMMKLADKKKKSNANTRPLFAMGRGTFPDQTQYRNLGLPKAEEQVKSIARLFGVSPLVGIEATEAKAVSEMGAARYVHFATHGELNEVAPLESAIVLGKGADDDGMLYARELVDMDLQAELVVLSACETGLGQPVRGEGILGLTWALFVAGTPTSVMTQWKVRDDSMNSLMLEFYRQMRLNGVNGQPAISKAEALRRAQFSLMKDDAYKHPYHWAPVALVGDWR